MDNQHQTKEEKKLGRKNDKLIDKVYNDLRKVYPKYEENFKDDEVTRTRDWMRHNKRLVRAYKTLRKSKTLQKHDIKSTLEPIIKSLSEAQKGPSWEQK